MIKSTYLLDKDFLKELDLQHHREVFARITSLTFDEIPKEEIQGRITAGSVNVDGNSAVRRTCSLTMVSENLNINDWQWGIKTKFRLEVGLRNSINPEYPDICWFPLGLYLVTSFTSSISANNSSISIQGKDKMCLLNGDLGGNLPASIDFGKEEVYVYHYLPEEVEEAHFEEKTYYRYDSDKKEYIKADSWESGVQYFVRELDKNGNEIQTLTYNYLTIATIIRDGVHHWACENYNNIIIKDLDTFGLEQLTYKGNVPFRVFYNVDDNDIQIQQTEYTGNIYFEEDPHTSISFRTALDNNLINEDHQLNGNGTRFRLVDDETKPIYTTVKYQYGDDIGYRITELTWPQGKDQKDGLISSIGETFTSVLDKIKNLLGDFEYFYNLDGQFVFQKKQTYENTYWSEIVKDGSGTLYVDPTASDIAYDFLDQYLVSSFNNNPTLNNLKNDYSVWGERTIASGTKIPIHSRYSIHNKPTYYKALDGIVYTTDQNIYDRLVEEESQSPTEEYPRGYTERFNAILHGSENSVDWFLRNHTFKDSNPAVPIFNNRTQSIGGYNRENIITNNYQLPKVWWDLEDWSDFYKIVTGKNRCPGSNDTLSGQESIYQYHSKELNDMGSLRQLDSNITVYPVYKIQNLYAPPILQTDTKKNTLYKEESAWLMLVGQIEKNGNPQSNTKTVYLFKGSSDLIGTVYTGNSNEAQVKTNYQSEFNNSDIANTYHLADQMTIYELLRDQLPNSTNPTESNSNHKFNNYYIKHIGNNRYERIALAAGEVFKYRIYIYNPQISPTDGTSIIDAIQKRIFRENNMFISQAKLNQYLVDWREIIYQMSLDYFANHANMKTDPNKEPLTLSDTFLSRIAANNREYYPTGRTGYEMYYTDLQGFWRQLYNPFLSDTITRNGNILTSEYYWNQQTVEYIQSLNETQGLTLDVTISGNNENIYWNTKTILNPTSLNFWFDFLDSGEIMKYSISEIGLRTKATNNTKLSSVYFKAIPHIIFYPGTEVEGWMILTEEQKKDKPGYNFIQLPAGMENTFSISSRYISIKDEIDNLLYQHTYVPENISLTSLPIYYLTPNTRILVRDDKTGINGEYIMTKFTLPLTYNGTMSITANKAPERIL